MSWDPAVFPPTPGEEGSGHHARDSQPTGKPWSGLEAPGASEGSLSNYHKVVGCKVTIQQSITFLYAAMYK